MIRSIIIDDESSARDGLKLVLEKFCPDVKILTLCTSPEEGVNAIHSLKPDLVFLDVQMPHKSGFNLLEELGDFDFEVIFVTAYDRYAIKAIRFSALDYLLKPVDIEELQKAVQRAAERISEKTSRSSYLSLLKNIRQAPQKLEKLAIPTFDGIILEPVDSIIFCEADRNYTNLMMVGDRKIVVSKNLKDFENMLSESGFFRIHHAYLINMKYVKKYVKGEGGYVILEGDRHVDVSRRKKEAFLQLLNKI